MTGVAPALSVVMPVHDGGDDLAEALASILDQTFRDFELVVVDDHSTDDTPQQLCAAAARDARVRVIQSPARGFVAAIGAGIAASTGTWIARMDADDRSHPARLARQVDYLRRHPDVDVLGTSAVVIDAGGRRQRVIRYPLHHPLIAVSLRASTTFAHGTVVMRRTALEAVGGYRADAFPVEDYDLWCRLVVAGFRTANLDEPLYDYRLSPGGVSRTVTARQDAMAAHVGARYARDVATVAGTVETWRAVGAIARAAGAGEIDDRALARASRSTRQTVGPWLASRRWRTALAAATGAARAEVAYRRRRLIARQRGRA